MQGACTLIGRLCLVAIFASSVFGYFMQWSATTDMMAQQGVPAQDVLLAGASLFLILGSISLILGWFTRIGAALLLIFLLIITPIFHDFWAVPQDQFRNQMIQFLKNLGLFGGLLYVLAYGAGPWSVDRMWRRRHPSATASETLGTPAGPGDEAHGG